MTDEGEAPRREELERALGYEFRDRRLLETSLTHASHAHESEPEGRGDASLASNERLEFLGDSVIGMVAAHLLYDAHPGWSEGDLTRALHRLVDRRGLAALARELALGAQLRLGRTERLSGGEAKDTILADAMEAVIGAMYLDGGIAPVEGFARRVFAAALAPDAPRVEPDPKTRLQEWVMAERGVFPTYRLVDDSEIEGDAERFRVELVVEGRGWIDGAGRSKRQAERRAAEAAFAQREELLRRHLRAVESGREARAGASRD